MSQNIEQLKCVWCESPIEGTKKTKYCNGKHRAYYHQRMWLNSEWDRTHGPQVEIKIAQV